MNDMNNAFNLVHTSCLNCITLKDLFESVTQCVVCTSFIIGKKVNSSVIVILSYIDGLDFVLLLSIP